jgi:hypothetical protein
MDMKLSNIALVCTALFAASAAHAEIFTFTGDTTGAPTFNRAFADFSALSGTGTAAAYDEFVFTVDTAGAYTFLTTGVFDTFTFLYQDAFDPSDATVNGIAANDDLLPGFTTSGIAASLTSGTTYILVTTGFGNSDFGAYSTTIGGPGIVTVVPEPGTYALMAAGLGVFAWRMRNRQASKV